MACTDGMADMCCTCAYCFREDIDGRMVYRCSVDGGRVSMIRRPCPLFVRDTSACIEARLNHGGYVYTIGCRCRTCMTGHESRLASSRAINAAISGAKRRTRDGR